MRRLMVRLVSGALAVVGAKLLYDRVVRPKVAASGAAEGSEGPLLGRVMRTACRRTGRLFKQLPDAGYPSNHPWDERHDGDRPRG